MNATTMSPHEVIAQVACITGVPAPAITGRRRTARISRARFLAVAAVRSSDRDLTFVELGGIFRRHHTAISNAVARHGELIQTDPSYLALTRKIIREVFAQPNHS